MAAEYDGRAANRAYRLVSAAASDNATVANSGPCCLTGVQGLNAKASTIYLKLYDAIAGATPAATDTPVKVLAIPASAAFVFDFPRGFAFRKGLSFRIVTGSADNDNTAVAAGDVLALNLDLI